MDHNEVANVLQELRAANGHINSDADVRRFDLDRLERAVARRERSVARLRELTLRKPEVFTLDDVEELQRILAEGKRAAENFRAIRRRGWTGTSEFRNNDCTLKTFLRYGPVPSA